MCGKLISSIIYFKCCFFALIGDYHRINGILITGHSIFKRYRYEFKSQELWEEIKFVLDTFAKPLTDLAVVSTAAILYLEIYQDRSTIFMQAQFSTMLN